jgi:hypothetical protein
VDHEIATRVWPDMTEAARAGSRRTRETSAASHSVAEAHPDEVAASIIDAATAASPATV